jgi:Fe-S cluster biosynthesis and repair protein YggX
MRTVTCRKYSEELPGLTAAPFPGPKGQDIYDHVSAKAWKEWQDHQTRLINEKHLNLFEPKTRQYLQEQMTLFLSGTQFDAVDGYVPETK